MRFVVRSHYGISWIVWDWLMERVIATRPSRREARAVAQKLNDGLKPESTGSVG